MDKSTRRTGVIIIDRPNEDETSDKMQPAEVMKLVNNTLVPFNGQIGKLGAFIINIQTLETIIPAEHRALAINCIRGKLEGTAAALIPSDATSAPSQHGLVNNIKAEPSTVVEARLSAIRFDNHNLTKFSEEVEKVASLLSQTIWIIWNTDSKGE